MKTSEIFKIAKTHLSVAYEDSLMGPQKFICNSLDLAAYKRQITRDEYHRCQRIVQGRMGDAETIEAWLAHMGHIPTRFLHDKDLCQRIQDYRHAWVDELIREFEAKGD